MKFHIKVIFTLILIQNLISGQCLVAQIIIVDSSKCYSQCIKPDIYDTIFTYKYLFTGDPLKEELDFLIDTIKIEIEPPYTKWEKRKADKGCFSYNPEDCMVWCMVEYPGKNKIETKFYIRDTLQTKNFKVLKNMEIFILEEGGTEKSMQIVCENDIKPELISKLQAFLISENYLNKKGLKKGKLDKKTNNALEEFQIENGLYYGALTIETLERIGLN
jgi:hypothetical protein